MQTVSLQRCKLTACATLTMLDDHTFDNICYLLTAIDGFFKFLVNVFPLDDLERVASLMEQGAYSSLINVVAFIFEAVQLDEALSHAFWFLQDRNDFIQLQGHPLNDSGKLPRRFCHFMDVVHD